MTNFGKELTDLLNRHSKENGSNTPDYILANMLQACMVTFDMAVKDRDKAKLLDEPFRTDNIDWEKIAIAVAERGIDSRFCKDGFWHWGYSRPDGTVANFKLSTKELLLKFYNSDKNDPANPFRAFESI